MTRTGITPLIGPAGYATHSAYSDPGAWAALLEDAPTDPAELSAVALNVIAHYRQYEEELPEATRDDIHARWLADALTLDQGRNPGPLAGERPLTARLQGCCRDHTLFCVGALRQHGIPARSRVGFATYFQEDWNHDHVVVEAWRDDRWIRFDPEVAWDAPFDRLDMPTGPESPFITSAEAWVAHRAGRIDVETFGVAPSLPIRGEWFVGTYVLMELAHRQKDELLLWDGWGVMGPEIGEHSDLLDEITSLLVAADTDDEAAETELAERYRSDPRLHPGDRVESFSPFGGVTEVALAR